MIQLYYAKIGEASECSNISVLKEMQIVLLNESFEETDRIIIKFPTLQNPNDSELLSMWRVVFDVAGMLFEGEEDRIRVFLFKSHFERFVNLKTRSKCKNWHSTMNIVLGKLFTDVDWTQTDLDQILSMLEGYNIDKLSDLGMVTITKRYKGQNLHLESMRRRKDYTFLGDNTTMLFHEKSCPRLEKTTKATLVGLSSHPKSQWKQCKKCKPKKTRTTRKKRTKVTSKTPTYESTAIWNGWEGKLIDFASRNGLTKSEAIGMQLKLLCEEYGIFSEPEHDTIHIITVSGEWFFNFSTSPIEIYHKNYYMNDGFHLQEKTFSTPIQAIEYIQKHDLKYMKKKLLGSPEHRLAKAVEKSPAPLKSEQYVN